MLELLHAHSDMALVVSDADGTITLATPALERMLGGATLRSIADADGMEVFDSSGEHALTIDEVPMVRALRGDTVIDDVISFRRPDGRTLFVRCNAGPLRGVGGEVSGAMTLVQDITAEWIATLKQKELRDRLVTTVNHELRTPLTKLIGHSELLVEAADDGELPQPLAKSVHAIARACEDLASMAERLTHLAHLDSATRVHPAPVDVADLMQSVVAAATPVAQSRGVRIRTAGLPQLSASIDGRLVSRATRELLANAIAHAPQSSTVTVGLHRLDGHLEIRVADEGPGIPVAERRRVVQPFERGDITTGSTSSTGLGLAVACAVAAAHGGTVLLEDNDPHGLVAKMCIRRNLG